MHNEKEKLNGREPQSDQEQGFLDERAQAYKEFEKFARGEDLDGENFDAEDLGNKNLDGADYDGTEKAERKFPTLEQHEIPEYPEKDEFNDGLFLTDEDKGADAEQKFSHTVTNEGANAGVLKIDGSSPTLFVNDGTGYKSIAEILLAAQGQQGFQNSDQKYERAIQDIAIHQQAIDELASSGRAVENKYGADGKLDYKVVYVLCEGNRVLSSMYKVSSSAHKSEIEHAPRQGDEGLDGQQQGASAVASGEMEAGEDGQHENDGSASGHSPTAPDRSIYRGNPEYIEQTEVSIPGESVLDFFAEHDSAQDSNAEERRAQDSFEGFAGEAAQSQIEEYPQDSQVESSFGAPAEEPGRDRVEEPVQEPVQDQTSAEEPIQNQTPAYESVQQDQIEELTSEPIETISEQTSAAPELDLSDEGAFDAESQTADGLITEADQQIAEAAEQTPTERIDEQIDKQGLEQTAYPEINTEQAETAIDFGHANKAAFAESGIRLAADNDTQGAKSRQESVGHRKLSSHDSETMPEISEDTEQLAAELEVAKETIRQLQAESGIRLAGIGAGLRAAQAAETTLRSKPEANTEANEFNSKESGWQEINFFTNPKIHEATAPTRHVSERQPIPLRTIRDLPDESRPEQKQSSENRIAESKVTNLGKDKLDKLEKQLAPQAPTAIVSTDERSIGNEQQTNTGVRKQNELTPSRLLKFAPKPRRAETTALTTRTAPAPGRRTAQNRQTGFRLVRAARVVRQPSKPGLQRFARNHEDQYRTAVAARRQARPIQAKNIERARAILQSFRNRNETRRAGQYNKGGQSDDQNQRLTNTPTVAPVKSQAKAA